jgi:hypothetical protein
VAGSCEYGDEPSGSDATDLVNYLLFTGTQRNDSSFLYGTTVFLGPWWCSG